MLQKHKEEPNEWSFAISLLHLDGYSEQFCDERCLTQAVSSVHPLHLSFPEHLHRLLSLWCLPCRFKRKEAQSWFDQTLDEAMNLFDQDIEICALSQQSQEQERVAELERIVGRLTMQLEMAKKPQIS